MLERTLPELHPGRLDPSPRSSVRGYRPHQGAGGKALRTAEALFPFKQVTDRRPIYSRKSLGLTTRLLNRSGAPTKSKICLRSSGINPKTSSLCRLSELISQLQLQLTSSASQRKVYEKIHFQKWRDIPITVPLRRKPKFRA